MIDDLGLDWIEEPIVYDNLDGYVQLAAELNTPIQIGENFYGPRDLHKALQCKACDFVMPDFMRIGGVTGWLGQRLLPARRVYRCRLTFTRRSPRMSCGLRKRRIGLNGRIGPIRSCKSRTPSKTA